MANPCFVLGFCLAWKSRSEIKRGKEGKRERAKKAQDHLSEQKNAGKISTKKFFFLLAFSWKTAREAKLLPAILQNKGIFFYSSRKRKRQDSRAFSQFFLRNIIGKDYYWYTASLIRKSSTLFVATCSHDFLGRCFSPSSFLERWRESCSLRMQIGSWEGEEKSSWNREKKGPKG